MKRKFFLTVDILAAVLIGAAFISVFYYAPIEKQMGIVQKIFYFHVSSAWIGFFAMFVTFVFSIIFLVTKSSFADDVAASSAELGLLFCSVVLVTGPLWAKPTWGIWWTWDPRLTATLVLWFIYAGYLLMRKFVQEHERRGVFSSILGIIGFIDVPIVFLSIQWWRTVHPNVVQKGGGGIEPAMLKVMIFSLIAFSFLYLSLLNKRVRLAKLERQLYERGE